MNMINNITELSFHAYTEHAGFYVGVACSVKVKDRVE